MRPSAALVLLGLTALCSCAAVGDTPANPGTCLAGHVAPDLTRLNSELAAESRWTAAGIHDDQCDASLSAYLPPNAGGPVRYVVRHDQTASVTSLTGGSTSFFGADGTQEAQFAAIHRRLNSHLDTQSCEYLSVRYDPADGHVVQIDQGDASPEVADANSVLTFSGFVRL